MKWQGALRFRMCNRKCLFRRNLAHSPQNYVRIASSDVKLARRISVLHEAQKNIATLVCKNDTGSGEKLCVVPQIRCVRIFGCSLHRSIFISRMNIHHQIQTIRPCLSQEIWISLLRWICREEGTKWVRLILNILYSYKLEAWRN